MRAGSTLLAFDQMGSMAAGAIPFREPYFQAPQATRSSMPDQPVDRGIAGRPEAADEAGMARMHAAERDDRQRRAAGQRGEAGRAE